MAVITIRIGDEIARDINTDDLTLGFFEDLETYQETKKTKDLITTLIDLLALERAHVRQVTIKQWVELAQQIGRASEVPPTSA